MRPNPRKRCRELRSERLFGPLPAKPRAGRAAEAARPAPPRSYPGREALHAPLFKALIERLDDSRRWIVFDLGRARTETIALLGRVRCRLEVLDIADDVERLNGEQDPRTLQRQVEALLPRERREPVDVVLCWDLLNYLSRPALAAVMEGIAARGRAGTYAHGLIYYSTPKMPAEPSLFVPLDDLQLVNLSQPTSGAERVAPRYSPEDLSRALPRYTVERARLLRNGMQEYLFQL